MNKIENFRIDFTDLDINKILKSNFSYEQNLINFVYEENGDINDVTVQSYDHYSMLSEKYKLSTTIVICMEHFNRKIYDFLLKLYNMHLINPPYNCHLYIANEGSYSYTEHKDPDDVLIYCIKGEKCMIVDNKKYYIKENEYLKIPLNTPHYAINEKESVILSIGHGVFIEDKIHAQSHLSENN